MDRQEDFNRETIDRLARVELGQMVHEKQIGDLRADLKGIVKEVRGIKYCLIFLSGALLVSQGPLATFIGQRLF